jgi:hypothetical protein
MTESDTRHSPFMIAPGPLAAKEQSTPALANAEALRV